MKNILLITLTILCLSSYAQDKYNYVQFNKLTEVEGTEYVIASVENRGKMLSHNNRYLLFINTTTGESEQVDFPNDGYFSEIKQIRIESLDINKIIVSAQTIDLDGKNGIDWNDPLQIVIISKDGLQKTRLTKDSSFVSNWKCNEQTGRLVVTGPYDSNNNGKYDKKDKNEILIFDLKTNQLIRKI